MCSSERRVEGERPLPERGPERVIPEVLVPKRALPGAIP